MSRRGGDERVALLLVVEIGGVKNAGAAGGVDLGDDGLAALSVPARHDYAGTLARELGGDRASDSGRRSSDERLLAREPHDREARRQSGRAHRVGA